MDNRFPADSGWVETPKIRKRMLSHDEKKKASSVPTTPVLQKDNHFDILSPPSSPTASKKKKKKRPRAIHTNSNRSPLVNEITDQWDDHIVPCDQLEGLNISRNEPDLKPDEALRQISFLDYLKDELTVADFDSAQELKRERVTNFLGVPAAFEKVKKKKTLFLLLLGIDIIKLMGFGFFVCLDSFLYTFTILPLRFCLAFYHFLIYVVRNIQVKLGQRTR